MTAATAETHRSLGVVLLVAVAAAVVGSELAGFLDGLLEVPQVAQYVSLVTASPLIVVVGAVALVVAATVVWRAPALCLYIVVGLLPFQFIGGTPDRGSVALPKLLINGALVGAVAVAVLRYPARLKELCDTPLGRAYAWLLAAIALGVVIGLVEGYPRFDWLRESNWYWFYALALAVAVLVPGWDELRPLISVLGAATLVAQLVGFYEFATGQRFTREEFADFFRAPFSQSASWMLFLTLAFGSFAMARGGRARGAGWLALSGVFALGAFLSFGRAEWAATVFGVVVTMGLVARAAGGRRAVVASSLLVPGMVVAAAVLARATGRDLLAAAGLAKTFAGSLVSGDDISVTGRLAEMGSAIASWAARPFGSGFGAPFAPVWEMGQDPAIPYYIHNSYFNTLVKLGPLGLAALLWVLYRAGQSAWETAWALPVGSVRQAVAVSFFAAIVKAGFIAFVVPYLSTSDAILHIAFVIGAVAVLHRVTAPRAAPVA